MRWLALTPLLLAACTVGPRYEPPPVDAPVAFKEAVDAGSADGGPTWSPAQPRDGAPRGEWWQVYGVPELDRLEAQVELDNETLKQAFENFMAARAVVAQARAQYYPTVSVGLGATVARTSANLGGAVGSAATGFAAGQGHTGSIFSIPIDISWAPDLWGRVRNAVRGAQYAAQVSAATLESQRLLQQATLAQLYFELRGQDALRQVLEDTVLADQRSLAYTQAQYETGIGTQVAVVEAQNTLAAVQAAAANLAIARAQYEHAIATLVGKPASSLSLPFDPRLCAAPAMPVGVPTELLERRPDVAAAERSMAEANAQIGVAVAAYYPSFTLSLGGGLEASNLGRLFQWPSRFWSVGPSLSETVFDGGLRQAEVRQYIHAYRATTAAYRQTVLTAFQQVEDALAAQRALAEEVEHQKRAVASGEAYVRLELARYETGIDPYVNVVLAQNALLTARQSLVQVQTQQLLTSVQLIQALGGGWDRRRLIAPDRVTDNPPPLR